MTRRPEGSGHLRLRSPGVWQWSLRLGNDLVTGKPRRVTKTFHAANLKQANAIASRLRAKVDETPPDGSAMTMTELFERWIEACEVKGLSPSTLHNSRRFVKNPIGPALGHIKVRDLRARHLDAFYAQQMKRGLKASTVRRYHATLSAALAQGVKWDLASENVAAKASPPSVVRDEVETPTRDQVGLIVDEIGQYGPHYAMAVVLAATTGLRRGELCGLRWCDVDGDQLAIRLAAVRLGGQTTTKKPKTNRVRRVPLAGNVAQVLEAWRLERLALAQGLSLEIEPDAFVLSPMPDQSEPLNPDTLTATFSKARDAVGLPRVHLHTLRHYVATEVSAQVSPADAAKVLGHANSRMILEVYGHATKDRQLAAAEVMGAGMPEL